MIKISPFVEFNRATRGVLAALVLLVSSVVCCRAGGVPSIIVTIKPLHSLVSSIAAGITEPHLLLDGSASPHTYALRPSDSRILQTAAIVVRISPNLEGFLDRPLAALASAATVVDAANAPGLTLFKVRGSGTFDPSGDSAPARPADPEEADVHIWLDANNAAIISEYLAAQFAAADPVNAGRYLDNVSALKKKLALLDDDVQNAVRSSSARPFIVFHDVTQYFEKRYGLHAAGAITVSPERQPGANRLAAIRARIDKLGAVCIFSEPQFPPKLVNMLSEGTATKHGSIDEIGSAIPAGPEHYFTFMRTMATAVAACLA